MEHHWCSTISTKQDLVSRGHLFPPPLSTSCKLSSNTSFAIQQMHNCRGCICNQVFLVKNRKSSPTSKHIQHSSCQNITVKRFVLVYTIQDKKHKRFWKIDRFSSVYVKETLTEPLNPYVSNSSLLFLLQRSINFQCYHIKFARPCPYYAPDSVKSYLGLVFLNIHPDDCSFK